MQQSKTFFWYIACRFMFIATTLTWIGCGDLVNQTSWQSQRQQPKLIGHTALSLNQAGGQVIVIGDSISAGIGSGHPKTLGYAALLYRNCDETFPAFRNQDLTHRLGEHLQFFNIAKGGDTTFDTLLQLQHFLANGPLADRMPIAGPTVVLMTAGGNDLGHMLRTGKLQHSQIYLQQALANLRQIIELLADPQRFAPPVVLVFGNVYDITDGTDNADSCFWGLSLPGFHSILEQWASAYRQLVTEAANKLPIELVDMLELFHGHGFHFNDPHNVYFHEDDPSLWLNDRDCIHPNNRGHHELRIAFDAKLRSLLPY